MKLLLLLIPLCLLASSVFAQEEWAKNPELANYLSAASGARIHSCSSTDSTEWMVHNIIDPSKQGTGVWRTANKKPLPQWVVIELPQVRELTTLAVNTAHINEDSFVGVTARVLKIEFSVVAPDAGYRRAGREYLHRNKDMQIVSLETGPARWVRLTIEGNWDYPYFAALGRVYAYNDVVLNQFEAVLMNEKKLTLSDIHFENNSAKLLPESHPILETIASVMHNNPDWHLIIEGHTDKTGTAQHNLALSQHRAEAVMQALMHVGISRDHLEATGLGAAHPVIDGTSEDANSQNRRVVFRLKE